jgi:hypothetical protein
MDLLKGSDCEQTRLLQHASHGLGCRLYLATFEKEIVKEDDDDPYYDPYGERSDDEDDDGPRDIDPYYEYNPRPDYEELTRNERLKHIVTLEGDELEEDKSRYDSGMYVDEDCYLDELDFDGEENPDDEEHSGFTGNAGATATYWYRDTVSTISQLI